MADVKPIPDGHQSITPYLAIKGAAEAISFYEKAFGAEEVCRMTCPRTGVIMHSELKIGSSHIYLSEECPDFRNLGPLSLGGSPVTIHLYVADTDATFARAVEAGAKAEVPPSDQFWGDRYSKVVDPFGHKWAIATHVEDVPPDQMQERMLAYFAAMSPSA